MRAVRACRAGGPSRWAWLACGTCRDVTGASADPVLALLPLGRHSLMNGRGVRVGAPLREVTVQQAAMLEALNVQESLQQWGRDEALRLCADAFPDLEEVPLPRWTAGLPESSVASEDAAQRWQAWALTQR